MSFTVPSTPPAAPPVPAPARRLRLAILGDYPLDPGKIGGGVEAVIVYLLQGLRQFEDLDLHVITLREDVAQLTVRQHAGVTAHYVPAAYQLGNLTFFIRNKLRLRRVLRDLRPDLIHAHIAGTYSEVAFSLGLPAVLTPHGIRYREAALKRGFMNRWVRYPLSRREELVGLQVASHIISISPYILDEFAGSLRAQVHPIENPINDAFYQIADDVQPGRLLFAGHVSARKGVLALIRALPQVRARCPHVQLHLAGEVVHDYDPDYFPQIQAVIREHQLEPHVRFLGHLGETDLLREYAQCSVFVLPSRQETAPMVIEQAMAAGKPVVATRVGGVPHLVADGETGLLVDVGDEAGLADALARLLADDALRTRMAARARQAAEQRFRADAVARQTYAVYQQILREHTRG